MSDIETTAVLGGSTRALTPTRPGMTAPRIAPAIWLAAVTIAGCSGARDGNAIDGGGGPGSDANDGSSPPDNAGQLEISGGPTYDFGDVGIGKSAVHTFQISNRAADDANTLTLSLRGQGVTWGSGLPATSTTCGGYLAAHATCSVTLAFAPQSAGEVAGGLDVGFTTTAGTGTASRALTGRGTGGAAVVIADAPAFDFGSLAPGATVDHGFVIVNRGNAAANRVSATIAGNAFQFKGGVYPGAGGTCAGAIPAGQSCAVVLTFGANSAGAASGSLRFDFVDADTGRDMAAEVALTGRIAAGAVLMISGGPEFSFGERPVNHPVEQVFTITNTGTAAATAMEGLAGGLDSFAVFAFANGAYPGTGSCASTLAAGASCTVSVVLTPYFVGAATGLLAINYDGEQRNAVALSATITTGIQLEIAEAPSFDFGVEVTDGERIDHVFTVRNTGVNDATGVRGEISGAPFFFTTGAAYPGGGSCGSLIAAGQACTVDLTYSQTTVGAATGTFRLEDLRADIAEIALAGRTSALSFVDGARFDFGTRVAGSRTDQKLFVTNKSRSAVVGLNAAISGAAYSFAGGSYPGTGGSCGFVLVVSGMCSIVVRFTPPGTDRYDGTLAVGGQSDQGAALQLAGQGQ